VQGNSPYIPLAADTPHVLAWSVDGNELVT
jgi:hypothetical protein